MLQNGFAAIGCGHRSVPFVESAANLGWGAIMKRYWKHLAAIAIVAAIAGDAVACGRRGHCGLRQHRRIRCCPATQSTTPPPGQRIDHVGPSPPASYADCPWCA